MVKVDYDKCLYCGGCVGVCPVNAITLYETRIEISDDCINCMTCVKFCPVGAIMEG
ncbi:MAG: ferredoxin [Thermoplasmata archaeon]|nr:MAG: ferredoxin [Thermoplasmata archaeon]HDN95470.1 4Fe-4S dicluster domain-containing protein [Thermoplasmatales archaeon]